MNNIILYIATSQDGFIADKNGSVDWLPQPQNTSELEIVGYNHLMSHIDTILMGSNSYHQILNFGNWAWPDKQTYVFSSKPLQSKHPYITITHDIPSQLISKIKSRQSPKDIWLLGGSLLAQSFAKLNLIDQIILTIIPKTLHQGIPLNLNLHNFLLTNQKPLIHGMIQKFYSRKKL